MHDKTENGRAIRRKLKTVAKVELFEYAKTLPRYFRRVNARKRKSAAYRHADRRSLDMAHVRSLLLCVNMSKCDSCGYAAAPCKHPAKVRIRRLQWIPCYRVNVGIRCKLHSVNTPKRRKSCGWQYAKVPTCRRVNGALHVTKTNRVISKSSVLKNVLNFR